MDQGRKRGDVEEFLLTRTLAIGSDSLAELFYFILKRFIYVQECFT